MRVVEDNDAYAPQRCSYGEREVAMVVVVVAVVVVVVMIAVVTVVVVIHPLNKSICSADARCSTERNRNTNFKFLARKK